ncbi:mechanosensitive ion channel domain-containing protein [Paraglaciecola sp. L1A13]|uniref:mechanosensitive ion channel domain-containing protein n=1 Tax=Paraglaciecola sp. L1A13 TaxID=2686359 RepID=UPI00131C00E8|nr:mechanosensitive ion channel domain-containing protein [Paraglaciecola sp. L1A13]
MLETHWVNNVIDWAHQYMGSLIWTAVMLIVYVVITKLTLPRIEKKIDESNLKTPEVLRAYHIIRLVFGILTFAVILIAWGIDFSGLLVISTSLITLTGVAFFASWSLLSNITAYFLLLFQTSFRRGNFIRVIDADNYVEGFITEINLFNTKLITEDREIIVYPNNLILTRPSIINPRAKWKTVGKVTDRPEQKIQQPRKK